MKGDLGEAARRTVGVIEGQGSMVFERKLLFYAAINVVREGRIMHERYERHLQRGMAKTKALTAIARKVLGILFALVRGQSEYVKNYEEIRLKQVA